VATSTAVSKASSEKDSTIPKLVLPPWQHQFFLPIIPGYFSHLYKDSPYTDEKNIRESGALSQQQFLACFFVVIGAKLLLAMNS
jgi:hypothetical protein